MNENHVIAIIEAFSRSDVAEIGLVEGNFQLVLRKEAVFSRSGQVQAGQGIAGDVAVLPSSATQAAGPTQEASGGQVHLGVPATSSGNETIDSPLVGTFYAASTPDSPPFVTQGAKIKAGEKLCILEAMKMMNNLEAEFDCEIVSVLASNGDLVEYGQALFEIKRT